MAFHSILWHSMAFHSILWHSMAFHSILWHSMAFYGIRWHSMAFYGIRWHSMALYGSFYGSFKRNLCEAEYEHGALTNFEVLAKKRSHGNGDRFPGLTFQSWRKFVVSPVLRSSGSAWKSSDLMRRANVEPALPPTSNGFVPPTVLDREPVLLSIETSRQHQFLMLVSTNQAASTCLWH